MSSRTEFCPLTAVQRRNICSMVQTAQLGCTGHGACSSASTEGVWGGGRGKGGGGSVVAALCAACEQALWTARLMQAAAAALGDSRCPHAL